MLLVVIIICVEDHGSKSGASSRTAVWMFWMSLGPKLGYVDIALDRAMASLISPPKRPVKRQLAPLTEGTSSSLRARADPAVEKALQLSTFEVSNRALMASCSAFLSHARHDKAES